MPQIEVIEKIEETIKVEIPKLYKVLLHNDDKTTVDFVVNVLVNVFHRTMSDAIQITLDIHNEGRGIAGAPYTREIAEEKVSEVTSYSRANGFPLKATLEEV
jgi:ATP-dependent Clp protease adaptor protein ClpS